MSQTTHHYTNGDTTVVWQPALCTHTARCFTGLPAVFDPRKRPWVDMAGADSAHIRQQVHRCPSGALSIEGEVPVDRA